MTDNVVVTYESDGKSIVFSKDSLFWLSDINGLGLDVISETTQSFNNKGEELQTQNVKGRNISLTGEIVGDVFKNRLLMLSCIVPFKSGVLSFEENGETWQIDVWPSKTPEIETGAGVQVFQFSLYAPYPFFRTKEQKTYVLSGYLPMWQTPFLMQEPFYISRQNPDAFTRITNVGDISQSFILEIFANATLTNPYITNVGTGAQIKIEKTMQKGDRFIISTHDKDKSSGDALIFISAGQISENAFRYIAPESDLDMQIQPGENIFVTQAEENKHNLHCVIVTAGGERHSL